jgi:hypothetical protein
MSNTGLRKSILRPHSAYHIEAGCVVIFSFVLPLSLYIRMYVYVMSELSLHVGTLCAVITRTVCLPEWFIALERRCVSLLPFPFVFNVIGPMEGHYFCSWVADPNTKHFHTWRDNIVNTFCLSFVLFPVCQRMWIQRNFALKSIFWALSDSFKIWFNIDFFRC